MEIKGLEAIAIILFFSGVFVWCFRPKDGRWNATKSKGWENKAHVKADEPRTTRKSFHGGFVVRNGYLECLPDKCKLEPQLEDNTKQ